MPEHANNRIYFATKALFFSLFRIWNRIEVGNPEAVARSGALILAPTHRSFLDIGAMAVASQRKSKFMAKRNLFTYAPVGAWLRMYGAFPVTGASADRAAINTCIEFLGAGDAVTIFPEGGLRSGPQVEEIYSGVAFIALKAACSIVPVGIAGTEQAMGVRMYWPRPRKVVVEFGEPIDIAAYQKLPRREALVTLTADLRTSMQSAFDRADARRLA